MHCNCPPRIESSSNNSSTADADAAAYAAYAAYAARAKMQKECAAVVRGIFKTPPRFPE